MIIGLLDMSLMQVLLLSIPGVHGESPEYKLITSLLSKYDINARPVMDPTKPIRVDMEVNLMQIIDLVRSMQISLVFTTLQYKIKKFLSRPTRNILQGVYIIVSFSIMLSFRIINHVLHINPELASQ